MNSITINEKFYIILDETHKYNDEIDKVENNYILYKDNALFNAYNQTYEECEFSDKGPIILSMESKFNIYKIIDGVFIPEIEKYL